MKKTFVLVHGAFAGKYAWNLVTPQLESAGNKVVTFDLPAHGDDNTNPQEAGFESYVSTVVNAIKEQTENVVLVGHSMGGVVISAVAEAIPSKIDKLVYLSAYIPQNGQSLQELAEIDGQSLIGRNLQFAPDYSGASLPNDVALQIFAQNCSDEIKEMITAKSKLEPLAAFQAKAVLTNENFGSVVKYYIETLQDQGVGNTLQKKMVADNGQIKQVFSLDCGHSPYFEKPNELSKILNEL